MHVVIVHGSYGNAKGNWFPWLADCVRGLGHEVLVPQFPTPENQSLSTWLKVFDEAAGALSGNRILIGHSLGVAFILRLLERTTEPIAGAFLVAGFLGALGLPEFDRINADFVLQPVDWSRVRHAARSFFVYGSDNDPYVPLSRGEQIAERLGTRIAVLKQAGHLNAESGFTTFPELLHDLQALLKGPL